MKNEDSFKEQQHPQKEIIYTPLNGRILIAMAKYGATSDIIIPNEEATSILSIGKVLAVAPGVKNLKVGDWVEVSHNLIASQSSGINDLRIRNEILEYSVCWMLNTQIVGKIEFPDGGEPGLLSRAEFERVKHVLGL